MEKRNTDSIPSFNAENRSYSGLGVVFNSDSNPLWIWDDRAGWVKVVERMAPTSFEDTDMRDMISAFNHNFEKVLASTRSGTLKLQMTERGIEYIIDRIPNTSYGNDLIEVTQRGDIAGSSFVFEMDYEEGYDIEEREDGTIVAYPKKITKMHEIGPVTRPAYPETTAQVKYREDDDDKKLTHPEAPVSVEQQRSFLAEAVRKHIVERNKKENPEPSEREKEIRRLLANDKHRI